MASTKREAAIAASERTCPRCATAREPGQDYCVDCGLRLPPVTGRLASLRRSWMRRIGWYPGDWIWVSLPTLLVAVAGAAVAIALTRGQRRKRRYDSHRLVGAATATGRAAADDEADHAPGGSGARRIDHTEGRDAQVDRESAERQADLADGHGRLDDRARVVSDLARTRSTTFDRAARRRDRPARSGRARLVRLLEPPSGLHDRLQRRLRLSFGRRSGFDERSRHGLRQRVHQGNLRLMPLSRHS